MKKIIKVLLALVLVLVVVVVALLFLGTIVKTGVEKVGPLVTKVPVKLDSASLSFFNGSGALKGFVLGNPEGFKSPEAVKVGAISLRLSRRSVLSDKVVIHSIRLEQPEITYETGLKGSNLGKILDNLSSGEKSGGGAPGDKGGNKGAQRKLQVDEFVITGARVHVAATMLGSTTVPLPEIRLTNLGQGADGITAAELSKKVMSEIVAATTKAVAGSAGDVGKGAADQLKKGASGVGDLFKKK